jgi:hypothetical protein
MNKDAGMIQVPLSRRRKYFLEEMRIVPHSIGVNGRLYVKKPECPVLCMGMNGLFWFGG